MKEEDTMKAHLLSTHYQLLNNKRIWKYLMVGCFVLTMIISFPPSVLADTYYVSPTGNNSNPGSLSQPWATPGYGSKQMRGGDTLIILPGTYRISVFDDDIITPPSGFANDWTVVKGQGATRPILQGSGSLYSAVILGERSYVKIEYLEITSRIDSPYSGGLRDGINALGGNEDARVSYITIENIVIHHIEETAINFPGNADHLIVKNCNLRYTGGTLVGSAHYNMGRGLEYVLIDSCYLGYGGHFYQGKEQQSPWDRPDGFGVEVSEGPIEIKNTLSEHNYGDGLDSKSKRTYIRNCRVENNYADGVKLWGDSSKVENTLIYGIGDGDPTPSPWVLLVTESNVPNSYFEITNVTMHDGSPRGHYTAGLQYALNIPCTIRLRNCIIQSLGTRFYCENSVNLIAQNNLFYITGENIQLQANGVNYDSSTITTLGSGNKYGDARFITPAWGRSGNYHLNPSSPAIDAGISGSGIPAYDLEYFPRPFGRAYDIGCYEYRNSVSVEEAMGTMPTAIVLWQNYPNPFNPSTTIRFILPQRSHVTLKIFDLLGREVTTLVNEWKEAGTHNIAFDIRPDKSGTFAILLSGVYFYRLQAGGFIETKKLLVLK
jgi:hypothetical protein